MTDVNTRIKALLEAIIADAPRARREIEKLLPSHKMAVDVSISIEPPAAVHWIPTFDPGVTRPLTPMLKARFDFASRITRFYRVWLGADEMASVMLGHSVRQMHDAIRNNWEGSAPMLVSDDRLSLFSTTLGNPEDLIYLVWKSDQDEPELWETCGMDSQLFASLEEFLKWLLR